jgi:hypothetical protein
MCSLLSVHWVVCLSLAQLHMAQDLHIKSLDLLENCPQFGPLPHLGSSSKFYQNYLECILYAFCMQVYIHCNAFY